MSHLLSNVESKRQISKHAPPGQYRIISIDTDGVKFHEGDFDSLSEARASIVREVEAETVHIYDDEDHVCGYANL